MSRSLGTLRFRLLVVGIGLLLSTGGPIAEATAGSRSVTADSVSAAAVAFALRYDALPSSSSAPDDRWWARDKALHLTGSALWTLSTQYVLVRKAEWSGTDALPVSVASGAAVGVAKELYDATRPSGTASARDLVADAVGIGLAAGVIAL